MLGRNSNYHPINPSFLENSSSQPSRNPQLRQLVLTSFAETAHGFFSRTKKSHGQKTRDANAVLSWGFLRVLHRIHETGVFTYMNGWFLMVNVSKYTLHWTYLNLVCLRLGMFGVLWLCCSGCQSSDWVIYVSSMVSMVHSWAPRVFRPGHEHTWKIIPVSK